MIGTRTRIGSAVQRRPQYSLINNQKREKLKDTLVDKFTIMLKANNNRDIIENEVINFLKKDKLNENDLKKLELSIKKKINTKQSKVNLKDKLSKKEFEEEENIIGTELKNPNLEDKEEKLNESGMSGGSDLDKFDNKGIDVRIKEQQIKNYQKIKEEELKNQTKKKSKIDYSKYANEWDAINMYNKKQFEEEKIREKKKDKEVKLRTKNDLDNQVKEKIKKEYVEQLKEKEYSDLVDNHLKKLDELERKKKEEIKKRSLQEKEMRDKQLKEKYVTKRIEYLKNKKYERKLLEQNKKDILEEKRIEMERKKEEKLALKKTLKDNELRKEILAENLRKEREEDIKIMEDHDQDEIRRENERKEYFNKIERNANAFSEKAVENVLKKQKEKELENERKLKQYEIDKENKLIELDKKREKEIREGKINYRHYLDKQVNDKKIRDNYEHEVDLAQAKIWKKDIENYNKHEKDVAKIIRDMNIRNLKTLDEQIKMKNNNLNDGMNENERLMNREILEKAYE